MKSAHRHCYILKPVNRVFSLGLLSGIITKFSEQYWSFYFWCCLYKKFNLSSHLRLISNFLCPRFWIIANMTFGISNRISNQSPHQVISCQASALISVSLFFTNLPTKWFLSILEIFLYVDLLFFLFLTAIFSFHAPRIPFYFGVTFSNHFRFHYFPMSSQSERQCLTVKPASPKGHFLSHRAPGHDVSFY